MIHNGRDLDRVVKNITEELNLDPMQSSLLCDILAIEFNLLWSK